MAIHALLRQTAVVKKANYKIDDYGETIVQWKEKQQVPCLLDRMNEEIKSHDAGVNTITYARVFLDSNTEILSVEKNNMPDRLLIEDEEWEVLGVKVEQGPALKLKVAELKKINK